MNATKFKVLGVNDDRDFCECCGKQNLARVVWIENTETGVIRHFGTTCAKAPAKGFGLDAEIKLALREWEFRQKCTAKAARRRYRLEGGKMDEVGPGHWRPADQALWDRCFIEAKAYAKTFSA